MSAGKIMELAAAQDIFESPLNPYTRALLAANPTVGSFADDFPPPLEGEVFSPVNPPPGCRLEPRCPMRVKRCKLTEPLLENKRVNHWVACHEVKA